MVTALLGTAVACTRPTATPAAAPSDGARTFEMIGHRGAAGLAPENTLASFSRACAVGVNGIELDVHLSADDQVVVHHDYALHPDLTRDRSGAYSITDPRPLLRSLPLPALREYDVGRVRPHSEYAARHPEQRAADGARIPTLDEVITMFLRECAPPTRLVVEIKGRRGENAKEKANTIRQYWVPAVNNDGGFGRWAVAEFTDVYAMEADFMATLEAAVDDLLALASATEPALA